MSAPGEANTCLFFIIFLLGCAGCQEERELPASNSALKSITTSAQGSLKLFNGTSFDGWEGVNEFFRIEDNAIVAGSMDKPTPQNEFLCTSRRFSNFRLMLITRLVGEKTNAGIQFRTERIPGSKEVIGYQADIGEGFWGGLYDESRRNRLLATADSNLIDEVVKHGEWNNYGIEAIGPHVRITINGRQTITYTEDDPDIPLEGHICLQIHSGPPGEQWYKSMMLEELD